MESKEPTDNSQNDDPSAQILNFPSPEQELEDCVQSTHQATNPAKPQNPAHHQQYHRLSRLNKPKTLQNKVEEHSTTMPAAMLC